MSHDSHSPGLQGPANLYQDSGWVFFLCQSDVTVSFWTSVLWAHLGPLWNRLGLEPCDKWLLGIPLPQNL